MTGQIQLHSAIQAGANIATGVVLSLICSQLLSPLFDFHVALMAVLETTAVFTVISIVRTYSHRRSFNFWHMAVS